VTDDASPAPVPAAAPVAGAQRIETLDVLRGFAVLGILAVNISYFADVSAVSMNPAVREAPSAAGWVVHTLMKVLAEGKFMTLFSVLFGAGIALFSDRVEARGRKPAGLHYRRIGWLWLIGMVHAYAIWYGDILVSYACCAAVAYLGRRWRPRTQLIVAAVLAAGPALGLLGFAAALPHLPPEAMKGVRAGMAPSAEIVAAEIAAYRGGWLAQMPQRAEESIAMQTVILWFFTGPRVTALMLTGMALLRLGVITGERRDAFYARLFAAGMAPGLLITVAGVAYSHHQGFSLEHSVLQAEFANYWGSLFMAAAYLAAVALLVRSQAWPGLRRRLGAAGRMAFSNYLGQSLICTTVFYGHGLGLFARVPGEWQALMVAAVWALQLWISPWWLDRYRFGPMEWLWRSLTYAAAQPMKRPAG
jgi:uncharacterized protein